MDKVIEKVIQMYYNKVNKGVENHAHKKLIHQSCSFVST